MDNSINMMDIEYLTKEQLSGFDKYKYSCKDTGPLSIYVMHPFWDWLVQFCPRSIAPNLLTFVGFLFTVTTFILFTWMDYDLFANDPDHPELEPLPGWAFLFTALFLFLAYTLDGIDGKQARRTGTSTPLGELFDHGLDSFTAGLIPIACFSLFGRGTVYSVSGYRMYFIMWNILLNFFVSHWEKYNTGVLFLPWGYDFSMWGTILLFIVTGLKGHEIWHFILPGGITSGNVFEVVLYSFGLVTNLPVVLYNIYMSYKNKTGYMRTFGEAMRPTVPVVLLFLIMMYWIVNSPGNIIEKEPRIMFLILSVIFSNICCRLIVAQMSSTRCEIFNLLLLPLLLTIGLSLSFKSALLELILVYLLCIITLIAHIHYGTCLVRQMCRHFGIDCFSIKEKN